MGKLFRVRVGSLRLKVGLDRFIVAVGISVPQIGLLIVGEGAGLTEISVEIRHWETEIPDIRDHNLRNGKGAVTSGGRAAVVFISNK